MQRIVNFLATRNPEKLFFLPDKIFLQLKYYALFGYKINFSDPKTFNEKLQWLKIYNHDPQYTELVDKYAVRKIVKDKLGEDFLINILGVWNRFEEIDFSRLPDCFVLKTTHNSGGVYICRNRNELNIKKAKQIILDNLSHNYYYAGREWPYKNVKPRIIAEEFISDKNGELTDYKFYCFNGYVDCVMSCYERSTGEPKFYFFDKDWKLLRINKRGKEAPEGFTKPKPACLNEMFSIAAKLSEGIPFVRVDLYEVDGKVYFGEMTFYPDSGFDPNYLPETDKYFGDLIDLSLAYKYKK